MLAAVNSMGIDDDNTNKKRVLFSPTVEVREYVPLQPRAEPDPGPGPGTELEDEGGPPPPKRGRPPDSSLVQAEKAMQLAEKRKRDAKRDLFERRDAFRAEDGAMHDAPSVAERAKQSI